MLGRPEGGLRQEASRGECSAGLLVPGNGVDAVRGVRVGEGHGASFAGVACGMQRTRGDAFPRVPGVAATAIHSFIAHTRVFISRAHCTRRC